MQEMAQEVLAYFQGNVLLSLGIAFVAGIAASKTVGTEGKGGIILYLVVGVMGFFLSQFAILFFGLKEYLEQLPEIRPLFDLIAAYVGSFIVATLIHFVKPM